MNIYQLAFALITAAACPVPGRANELADSQSALPAQAVKDVNSSYGSYMEATADNSKLADDIEAAKKLPAAKGYKVTSECYNKLLGNYSIMESNITVVVDGLGTVIAALENHQTISNSDEFVNDLLLKTREEIRQDENRQEELLSQLDLAGPGASPEDLESAAGEIGFFKMRRESASEMAKIQKELKKTASSGKKAIDQLKLVRTIWQMKLNQVSSEGRLIQAKRQGYGSSIVFPLMFGFNPKSARTGRVDLSKLNPPDTGISKLLNGGQEPASTHAADIESVRALLVERSKRFNK